MKATEIFRFSDNFPTFTINASIFLKLWRGRWNGGMVGRGKRMGDNNNKPWQNKVKIRVGHVLMLLCDSSLESESHRCKIVFFLYLDVIVSNNPRTISWYSQILWCYFCNYWQQQHTVSICSKQWLSCSFIKKVTEAVVHYSSYNKEVYTSTAQRISEQVIHTKTCLQNL